jgi:hypothetical protein
MSNSWGPFASPTTEPWVRYRDSSLFVVPSVHFRLPFAQQVYRACLRKSFDVIAVELPGCYPSVELLDAALRLGPMPGIVIDPVGDEFPLAVPLTSHPDCRDVRIVAVRSARVVPLVPCDSVATALRCRTLLAHRWPGWQPTIDFVDAAPDDSPRRSSPVPLPDPYAICREGLAAYQRRVDSQFADLPVDAVDLRREAIMAARLRKYLEQGRDVLFVCGGAHWRRIAELLDRGSPDVAAPTLASRDAPLIRASVRPDIAWRLGWLDCMPQLVWRFQQGFADESAASFDARAEVSQMIGESVATVGERAGSGISLRRLTLMARYQRSLLVSRQSLVPDLDDLMHVAASSVSDAYADRLCSLALHYPAARPENTPLADIVPLGGDRYVAVIGERGYEFELPSAGTDGGPKWRFLSRGDGGEEQEPEWWRRHQGPTPLSEKEKSERRASCGYLRSWPAEMRLLRLMRRRAESLIRHDDRAKRSRKFQGCMLDGPDWRGTIASFSRGERSLYVAQLVTRSGNQTASRNLLPPVVWLFDHMARIASHLSAEDRLSDDHWFKTGLFYATTSRRLAEGSIQQLEMAVLVDLGLGRMSRPGAGWECELEPEEATNFTAEYLAKVPPEKRCAQSFWSDTDLAAFEGVDQALAGAIKYADDHVILVCGPDCSLSNQVREFARQRGVEIRRLSSDRFSRESLARLRLAHYVPSPRDTFQPPFPWVERFVPRVGPPVE